MCYELYLGRRSSTDIVSSFEPEQVQLQWTKRYVPVHKMLYSEFQALWGAQLYRANEVSFQPPNPGGLINDSQRPGLVVV